MVRIGYVLWILWTLNELHKTIIHVNRQPVDQKHTKFETTDLNVLNSSSLPLNWSHGGYLLTQSHESYLRKGNLINGSHSFFFHPSITHHLLPSFPCVLSLTGFYETRWHLVCADSTQSFTIVQHPWTVWDAKDLWYVFFFLIIIYSSFFFTG